MSSTNKKITELDGHPIHPAAALFELLKPKDFKQLVDDIKANGLQETIKLFGGQILDGVNRVRACLEAGVPREYDELSPGTNPWHFVLSANIHRRHLPASQRAVIVAKALKKERQEAKAAAKERQRSGKGDDGSGGRGKKTSGHKKPQVSDAGLVAEEAQVSESTAKKAVAVEDADPELAQEVVEGKTTLNKAHERVKKTSGHDKPKVSRTPRQDTEAPASKEYDPEDHEFVPSKGTPTTELWARLEVAVSNARVVLEALKQRDVDVDEMPELVDRFVEQLEKARAQAV